MAGERGPLKIPPHLRAVKDGDAVAGEETAAVAVPAMAPNKPAAIARNRELSTLWDQIVPELDRCGLLAPSDGPALELALRHFQLARKAHTSVRSITVRDTNHGGTKKNPAEAIFRAESDMFLRYAGQLGMTFVSRARTPMPGGEDEPNPFRGTGTGS